MTVSPAAVSPAAVSPPTLLQLAGVSLPPPAFSRSVVVLIDVQREYCDGALPLAGLDAALYGLSALLAKARAAAAPVVHVVHVGRPGGPLFAPDGPFAAILPEAAPAPGEEIIEKTLPNGFTGTGLQAAVDRAGRREIIFAGFMTHNCVEATARGALDLGYRSVVAADATATRPLPDPITGESIPAALIQRASLAALADRSATTVLVENIGA